ncbi:MAG TPA: hypothetical protein VNZ61_06655 [Roseomonas sp.]|nr:hypothetical protein [Roseomonas sp.]
MAIDNMLFFKQVSRGPLRATRAATLPGLILTIMAQWQLVAGLTAGAVKDG